MGELSPPTAATSEDIPRQRLLNGDDVVSTGSARLYADFGAQRTFADVMSVLTQSRADLSTCSAGSLADLLERLARQRLSDSGSTYAYPAPPESEPSPTLGGMAIIDLSHHHAPGS
jgi:hypothetical protein